MEELLHVLQLQLDEYAFSHSAYFTPTDSILEYHSLSERFTEDEVKAFEMLPSIAQKCFKEAGRCIAYDVRFGAMSLALVALESTLRYYFRRCNPKDKYKGWKGMVNWLNSNELLPGVKCKDSLEMLEKKYRNLILHGRAFYQKGKPDLDFTEAKKVFDDCLDTALKLMLANTGR